MHLAVDPRIQRKSSGCTTDDPGHGSHPSHSKGSHGGSHNTTENHSADRSVHRPRDPVIGVPASDCAGHSTHECTRCQTPGGTYKGARGKAGKSGQISGVVSENTAQQGGTRNGSSGTIGPGGGQFVRSSLVFVLFLRTVVLNLV